LEEAQAVGDMMKKDINAFYAAYVKKYHNRDSFLDLEYEKTFLRFLMPKIRNVDVGAKKRYAGLVMRDGKEKIEITGLEFVRRDWTEASKRFQLELIDRVFHQQDLTKYIKNFVADLKSGKFDEQLIYRKELRKSIELYTKTTPPHVKAARLMPKLEGSLISYVMTTSGPEPVDYRKGKIDYEHYIEKQIKPIADGILSFYELKFDEVIAGNRQKSLLGF
jgi:DNA polymerase-2